MIPLLRMWHMNRVHVEAPEQRDRTVDSPTRATMRIQHKAITLRTIHTHTHTEETSLVADGEPSQLCAVAGAHAQKQNAKMRKEMCAARGNSRRPLRHSTLSTEMRREGERGYGKEGGKEQEGSETGGTERGREGKRGEGERREGRRGSGKAG